MTHLEIVGPGAEWQREAGEDIPASFHRAGELRTAQQYAGALEDLAAQWRWRCPSCGAPPVVTSLAMTFAFHRGNAGDWRECSFGELPDGRWSHA